MLIYNNKSKRAVAEGLTIIQKPSMLFTWSVLCPGAEGTISTTPMMQIRIVWISKVKEFPYYNS